MPDIGAETDIDGRFFFSVHAPGLYAFTAHADSFPNQPATSSLMITGLVESSPSGESPKGPYTEYIYPIRLRERQVN